MEEAGDVEMKDPCRATYVQQPVEKAVGLDLNSFVGGQGT